MSTFLALLARGVSVRSIAPLGYGLSIPDALALPRSSSLPRNNMLYLALPSTL